MIFTILVSFSRDNALFALKAKINEKWSEKKFLTTLILVFEVIVQPTKVVVIFKKSISRVAQFETISKNVDFSL